MTKTLMLASVLLFSAAWIQAQQYPQTGSKASGASSGQTKVEGCLQGANGNFTLTDTMGKTYQLEADASMLSEHVGHEVQVTGTVAAAAGESGSMAGTASSGAQQPTLQVQHLKHVSKSCKTGSKMQGQRTFFLPTRVLDSGRLASC
jgi:hypothetical protein